MVLDIRINVKVWCKGLVQEVQEALVKKQLLEKAAFFDPLATNH
jgi:hypothetical protein